MSATVASRKTFLQKLLDGVEIVGNKVPHPAIIFLIMSAIVIVLSQLVPHAGYQRHVSGHRSGNAQGLQIRQPPSTAC